MVRDKKINRAKRFKKYIRKIFNIFSLSFFIVIFIFGVIGACIEIDSFVDFVTLFVVCIIFLQEILDLLPEYFKKFKKL